MRALLKALFLGLLLLAAPSTARDAPGEGPELLTVPFDPPLGQALAYTVMIVKNRSAGESRMELEQELTFERLGKGYLLRLAMLGATIDGTRIDLTDEAMLEAIPAPVRPFLMSVAIELDAAGEPLRLRDWDEMRAMRRNLPGLAAERAGEEERERAREIAALVFGPLLSLSAEEAPHAIVRGWPEVLGYGGLELEDGELYAMDDRMDGGLLPEPVPATLESSLSRTESGALRFEQVTRPDPAAMSAALSALRDELFAGAPPREREVGGEVESEAGGFSMADTLRIVFDGETGMPTSARIERMVEAGEGARGNVITIERRAP